MLESPEFRDHTHYTDYKLTLVQPTQACQAVGHNLVPNTLFFHCIKYKRWCAGGVRVHATACHHCDPSEEHTTNTGGLQLLCDKRASQRRLEVQHPINEHP